MRVVLDTNILIAALLVQTGPPATIYTKWTEGAFTLLGCEEQLSELRQTLRKPKIAARIRPHNAGRMVNALRSFAKTLDSLPSIKCSSDPADNLFLAMAEAGRADFLVTGDKSGLLSLKRHHATRIVTARAFADLLK